jgi:SAM-dependent methyltransferase
VETASEAYAARFAGPTGAWFLEVQSAGVAHLLAGVDGGRLRTLEVGGGHGQLTGPFLAAGHCVVVHGSRLACHRRRSRRPAPPPARVVSALWALPFADGSFDLVTGVRLLAHTEPWKDLVAEMARVSRGLVLVDFPVVGALHRAAPTLFALKRRLEGNTRPYFTYSVAEMEAAFRRLGLRPAGRIRQFLFPMAMHRALRSPGASARLEKWAQALGLTARYGSPVLLLGCRGGAPPPAADARGAR